MIARPPRTIPVPDAVADLAARQLPAHALAAVDEAGLCGRLLTGRTLIACRDEEPQEIADPNRDWEETPAEAARYDRWWGDRDTNRDED